ncbi:hypothetical protein OG21DRAFT_1527896 [Imleria badia]|nr:hypothetical protein OG21DRAFT_1527896 [Imleria badia]
MASVLESTSSLSPSDVTLLNGLNIRLTSIGLVLDCEGCGNAIVITFCQSDHNGNAGKPLARHPQCQFFKWFPHLLQHPQILSLIKAPASPPSSQVACVRDVNIIPSQKKAHWHGVQCLDALCRRSAALQCIKNMCRSHCKDMGGHAFHGIVDPGSEFIDINAADSDEGVADGNEGVADNLDLDWTLLPVVLPPPLFPDSVVPLSSQSRTNPLPVLPPPPSLSELIPPPSSKSCALPPASQSRAMAMPATRSLKAADGGKTHPQITRQLDPLWMEDLSKLAAKEVENQKAICLELGHLFIHRYGVTWCLGFDQDLQVARDSKRPAHLRLNMRSECDGTHVKLKARATSQLHIDSDSEVEIIEVSSSRTRASNKRHRSTSVASSSARSHYAPALSSGSPVKEEPSSSLPTLSFKFASSPTSSSTSLSSMLPVVPQLLQQVVSLPPALLVSPSLPPVIHVTVPQYEKRQVWPHGMYMVDMTARFCQLVSKQLQAAYSPPKLFRLVFGVPFVKPTYYDNLKAWKDMSQHLLEECEAAGHTPSGLWSYYLAGRHRALDVKSKPKVPKLDS